MKPGKQSLSQAASFRLMKLIEAHGATDDKHWTYEDGWSDERIAAELGISIDTVARRRRDVFGVLKKIGSDLLRKNATYDSRISALEVKVADMEAFLLNYRPMPMPRHAPIDTPTKNGS